MVLRAVLNLEDRIWPSSDFQQPDPPVHQSCRMRTLTHCSTNEYV